MLEDGPGKRGGASLAKVGGFCCAVAPSSPTGPKLDERRVRAALIFEGFDIQFKACGAEHEQASSGISSQAIAAALSQPSARVLSSTGSLQGDCFAITLNGKDVVLKVPGGVNMSLKDGKLGPSDEGELELALSLFSMNVAAANALSDPSKITDQGLFDDLKKRIVLPIAVGFIEGREEGGAAVISPFQHHISLEEAKKHLTPLSLARGLVRLGNLVDKATVFQIWDGGTDNFVVATDAKGQIQFDSDGLPLVMSIDVGSLNEPENKAKPRMTMNIMKGVVITKFGGPEAGAELFKKALNEEGLAS